ASDYWSGLAAGDCSLCSDDGYDHDRHGRSSRPDRAAVSHQLVTEEAEAADSPRFVATKCHDGRFPTFTLLYLLLASSSFCLPLCFAFCVLLATLPLFRFSLFDVDLFNLAFDCLG